MHYWTLDLLLGNKKGSSFREFSIMWKLPSSSKREWIWGRMLGQKIFKVRIFQALRLEFSMSDWLWSDLGTLGVFILNSVLQQRVAKFLWHNFWHFLLCVLQVVRNNNNNSQPALAVSSTKLPDFAIQGEPALSTEQALETEAVFTSWSRRIFTGVAKAR